VRYRAIQRLADGHPAGGVFGQLSVADGGVRSADAETLDDCQLLFVRGRRSRTFARAFRPSRRP
jgi:CRP-like cAMP-binding protein